MHVVPRVVQDSLSSLSTKFTPANRLRRENGFGHVIRAKSVVDRCYKVYFERNCNKSARLGIIVGKKTLACATDRNRVKRIIRETFRQHSVKLCTLDIVVMVRHADAQTVAQVNGLKLLFSRVEKKCAEF